MKKIFIIPVIFASLSFFSCNKESLPAKPDAASTADPTSRIINPNGNVFTSCNNWTVLSYINNGSDQTTVYANDKFEFCPDNTLTISNDAMSNNAKWFFATQRDNVFFLHIDLDANAAHPSSWDQLAGRWAVTSATSSNITLESPEGIKKLELAIIVR